MATNPYNWATYYPSYGEETEDKMFDPYGNPQGGYGQPQWGAQEQQEPQPGTQQAQHSWNRPGAGGNIPAQDPDGSARPGLDQGQIPPGPQPTTLAPPGGAAPGLQPFQGFQFFKPGQIPELNLPGFSPFQFSQPNLPGFGAEDALMRQQVMQVLQNPANPAADYAQEEALTKQLINQILSQPESLNDLDVQRLKERNKEEALGYEGQILDQMQQQAASRGTLYGGNLAAQERRTKENTASSVLKGNRDIDIDVAGRRFGDRLNALSSASAALGQGYDRSAKGTDARLQAIRGANETLQGILQRGLAPAQFGLQREMAQAGENQFAAQHGMNAQQLALQRALGEGNLNLGADNLLFNYAQLQEQAYQNWLRSLGL